MSRKLEEHERVKFWREVSQKRENARRTDELASLKKQVSASNNL